LTLAAIEAIEQAAAEAAKAATLAAVEREAVLLREKALAVQEARHWQFEADLRLGAIAEAKRAGTKNTVLGIVLGILGGLAIGIGVQNLLP
jgi:hypothetical protein